MMKANWLNASKACIFLAIALYLGSLAAPAIIYKDGPEVRSQVDYGFQVLAWGWAGVLLGSNFAWLANLFGPMAFLISLFAKRSRDFAVAYALGLLALAFSLNSLSLERVPLDEGGVNYAYLDHFAFGYFLWEASLFVLAGALLVRLWSERMKLAPAT